VVGWWGDRRRISLRKVKEYLADNSPLEGPFKVEKVLNNTFVVKYENGGVIFRFWSTNLMVKYPDGTIVLDTGGWVSFTTRGRLRYLSSAFLEKEGWEVSVEHLRSLGDGDTHEFVDGMKITPMGLVLYPE